MEPLRVRDYVFNSRLILGSGRYKDYDEMLACWDAAGVDCVTVALRRVDLEHKEEERNLIDVIDRERYTILPNTAGLLHERRRAAHRAARARARAWATSSSSR